MFSVIIPLYNKSEYVESCLKTVIEQTYRKFEIIVINDGSTDDGLEKIEKFISKNFFASAIIELPKIEIISQINSGVSVARNNGAKAAKYDYLAFLDADDWWDCHFLEEMKDLIVQNPAAGLYGSNYYYVKNGTNKIEEKGLTKNFTSGYIDYIKLYASTFCVPINCSFVVVPKAAFNEVGGFKKELKFGEDFDLWIRLALKHKVAYINEPLAYSNQDLPQGLRAIDNKKYYRQNNHFIFNIGYLMDFEKTDPDLKALIDGLRVRLLQKYYLSGMLPNEVKTELAKVDFGKQPAYYKFFYNSPKLFVKLLFYLRNVGSKIKQHTIIHNWNKK